MKSISGKLFTLALCSLVSVPALSGGNIGWRQIESIYQRDCELGRGLEITLTAPHLNPDYCSDNRIVEVACDMSTYKTIVAMALTAQAADMEINGYVNTCDYQGQANLKSILIR